MATIKIDGVDYDSDSISEEAKREYGSLLFVKNEIKRLDLQIAAYKTAEIAYSNALTQAIKKSQ